MGGSSEETSRWHEGLQLTLLLPGREVRLSSVEDNTCHSNVYQNQTWNKIAQQDQLMLVFKSANQQIFLRIFDLLHN